MKKIVNLHDDFPVEIFCDRFFGTGNATKRLDMIASLCKTAVGAVFLPTKFAFVPRFQQRALGFAESCLSSDERFSEKSGGTKMFFALEGLDSFENAVEVEKILPKIKFLSLTWARENAFASGVGEKGESGEGGLKKEGLKLAEILKSTGRFVDVSHLNDSGIKELEKMNCRLFASHSNVRDVFRTKRNLPRFAIEKIAESGGVVGLNGYKRFIGRFDLFHKFAEHLLYLVNIGGESLPALGLDICGDLLGDNSDCDLIKNERDLEKLFDFLQKEGFSARQLEKLFFKNADDFLERLV